MHDRTIEDEVEVKKQLLEMLREEVARLLCSDDVCEEEKVARIKRAQEIFERGDQ